MLKYYIDFKIKFKKIYKNININNDIINLIWLKYKKLIALDIILKFLKKHICFCKCCKCPNWKCNPKTKKKNFL